MLLNCDEKPGLVKEKELIPKAPSKSGQKKSRFLNCVNVLGVVCVNPYANNGNKKMIQLRTDDFFKATSKRYKLVSLNEALQSLL